MTAFEYPTLDQPLVLDRLVAARQQQGAIHAIGELFDVFVDDEWCVVTGGSDLATALGLAPDSLEGTPLGRLIHPDDVVVSPARIWRSGRVAVLKFRTVNDDYLRLAVKIRRGSRGWLLTCSEVEAEVLVLPTPSEIQL